MSVGIQIDPDARLVFVRRLREELKAQITDENGQPIEFEEGPVEGPQPDRDFGCVWYEGARPLAKAGLVGEEFYRIRLFKRWRQPQPGAELATPHAQLLMAQAELEAALRANLVSAGHDYFVVREISPDYQQQSIEAQLTAYDMNPTAAGG